MLELAHNPWLVLASFAIALMAGFTGLSLTRGAGALPVLERKFVVALAAVTLGGGIWSMHFVAMLGMRLPIPFYFDPLNTLASAMVAILVVGLAFLLLHFRMRTANAVTFSGAVIGAGIGAMHFIGMDGMRLCQPVNGILDYALTLAVAVLLGVVAMRISYGTRTRRSLLLGALSFATAVVSAHFVAIGLTEFRVGNDLGGDGPALSREMLAIGVTTVAFVFCSAFLLSSVTFFGRVDAAASAVALSGGKSGARPQRNGNAGNSGTTEERDTDLPAESFAEASLSDTHEAGVPFEREGQTNFASRADISAIRAEGHYSLLRIGQNELLCPWSISEAETRLRRSGFIRCHRSYLLAPSHVARFERVKDAGFCYIEVATGSDSSTEVKVPVSRTRLAEVREALGL